MRAFVLAAGLGLGGLLFGAGAADAHGPRGHAGYGNGAHDFVPHWHQTRTPFGSLYWYGNGPHDYRPHGHTVSPWGGVRSYSYTPFGPTRSYNGLPYSGGYPWYYRGYGGWGW